VVPGAISSQYLSGLLIAAACGGIDLTVRCDTPLVQPAYVQMTQTCLQAFGADISRLADATWRVAPAHLAGIPYIVEADASTACYFWGAAAATGGRVVVANIDARCTQADMAFLPLLQQMGCTVEHLPQGIAVTGPARLRGNFEADLQHCADQAPTLAALAALADGPIIIRNVAHIRHHECDRIAAMAAVLDGLGGRVEAAVDGLRVAPQALHGAAVSSHGDHRIAMATALLALRTPGVRILGPACVSKTCPEFFSLLRSLGVAVQLHGRGHA
jgi:3-phosphoshikimate 1-carboxyvinyltransferase